VSTVNSSPLPDAAAPTPGRRAESEAIYAAFSAGVVGAIYGLVVGVFAPDLQLAGEADSFAVWAACGAAVVAAIASTTEYWRARNHPGQEWRQTLPSWKYIVNTISVVIVHTALAFVAVYALYRVLAMGCRS
jgi:drug/metabolite transporter (DMT)-like permease